MLNKYPGFLVTQEKYADCVGEPKDSIGVKDSRMVYLLEGPVTVLSQITWAILWSVVSRQKVDKAFP